MAFKSKNISRQIIGRQIITFFLTGPFEKKTGPGQFCTPDFWRIRYQQAKRARELRSLNWL